MRAALLTQWRQPLTIETLPDPACLEDGVVLKVLACGVCRSDWHAWTGADPDVTLPHVPGHEFCGVVEEAGANVKNWRKGDRVIAPFILACGACADCAAGHQTICHRQLLPGFSIPGAFAQYVAVPYADSNLAALPDDLDEALAAALGCRTTTAWHALTDRARLQPGEWLAIFGVGGVGLSALLIAKAIGARIIAIDIAPEKLRHARQHGADFVLDAREPDFLDALKDMTGGGAHVSVEALGITETTVNSIKALRKLGRHVQIGMPTGAHAAMQIPMDAIYTGQLALYGTRGMPAWRYRSLFALIESGRLDLSPLVARRIALSAATEELKAFDGPAAPGVAVITDFQA